MLTLWATNPAVVARPCACTAKDQRWKPPRPAKLQNCPVIGDYSGSRGFISRDGHAAVVEQKALSDAMCSAQLVSNGHNAWHDVRTVFVSVASILHSLESL